MRYERKRKTRSNLGSGSKSASDWLRLIHLAEAKLEKTRIKQAQLEVMLTDWRKQSAKGAPSPIDVASLGNDLSKLLQ